MSDFYLKADDKEAFDAALDAAGFVTKFGIMVPAGDSLDIIGIIRQPTGNVLTDEEGIEYPELETITGYHANYRGEELPEALTQFEIPAPDNPVRV